MKQSPINYAQNLKNHWRIFAKNRRSVFIQKQRFECLILDNPCEEMRYQIFHTLLEQEEKESLQGDFLQFEFTVRKIRFFFILNNFIRESRGREF